MLWRRRYERLAPRFLDSARCAVPADAGPGAAWRPPRSRLSLRWRAAGAGRCHHLCADAPRRARLARRIRRGAGRPLRDIAGDPAAGRVRRGRGGVRPGIGRYARPRAADPRHRKAAAAGAAGARLEASLACPCAGAVRRGDRGSGLGSRRAMAFARPCRPAGRDRDRRHRLGQACRSGRRQARRLVAGDARFSRYRHRCLAEIPR